jgi:hypothetical protein
LYAIQDALEAELVYGTNYNLMLDILTLPAFCL